MRLNSDSARIDFVRGDTTGLQIPAHSDALRTAGAAFLTEAFRAFGSLSLTNQVTRITRCEKCNGGSTGEKLFLSVEYAHPEPGQHTDLFVKFSRDFNDSVRDNRGKYEMESEIVFATMSRLPGFPINVPTAYFADYHHESKTGVLITEQIPFGLNGIEPHHMKCLDHDLADPLSHYQTIVKALARIAAAHKSGRLAPDIAARFPYAPAVAAAANPIVYDPARLRELIAEYGDFARRYNQLLPTPITSKEFITKLDADVIRFHAHEAAIRQFLQSNADLIALCHWNAQIDNAWFWRDASGRMQCGLMDWGHVSRMNVAFSLWGCLSGAGLEIWDGHFDELLALFAQEYHEQGGPRIQVADLRLHLLLYAAMMFMTYFIGSPARILQRLPEAATASGPLDPVFRQCDPARNNLHILAVVLSLWRKHDLGALLESQVWK